MQAARPKQSGGQDMQRQLAIASALRDNPSSGAGSGPNICKECGGLMRGGVCNRCGYVSAG